MSQDFDPIKLLPSLTDPLPLRSVGNPDEFNDTMEKTLVELQRNLQSLNDDFIRKANVIAEDINNVAPNMDAVLGAKDQADAAAASATAAAGSATAAAASQAVCELIEGNLTDGATSEARPGSTMKRDNNGATEVGPATEPNHAVSLLTMTALSEDVEQSISDANTAVQQMREDVTASLALVDGKISGALKALTGFVGFLPFEPGASDPFLAADGQDVLAADYPGLYGKIGRRFTGSETPADGFNVPAVTTQTRAVPDIGVPQDFANVLGELSLAYNYPLSQTARDKATGTYYTFVHNAHMSSTSAAYSIIKSHVDGDAKSVVIDGVYTGATNITTPGGFFFDDGFGILVLFYANGCAKVVLNDANNQATLTVVSSYPPGMYTNVGQPVLQLTDRSFLGFSTASSSYYYSFVHWLLGSAVPSGSVVHYDRPVPDLWTSTYVQYSFGVSLPGNKMYVCKGTGNMEAFIAKVHEWGIENVASGLYSGKNQLGARWPMGVAFVDISGNGTAFFVLDRLYNVAGNSHWIYLLTIENDIPSWWLLNGREILMGIAGYNLLAPFYAPELGGVVGLSINPALPHKIWPVAGAGAAIKPYIFTGKTG